MPLSPTIWLKYTREGLLAPAHTVCVLLISFSNQFGCWWASHWLATRKFFSLAKTMGSGTSSYLYSLFKIFLPRLSPRKETPVCEDAWQLPLTTEWFQEPRIMVTLSCIFSWAWVIFGKSWDGSLLSIWDLVQWRLHSFPSQQL